MGERNEEPRRDENPRGTEQRRRTGLFALFLIALVIIVGVIAVFYFSGDGGTSLDTNNEDQTEEPADSQDT
ncbi:hypothetical protein [Alkalibacterium sp. 20]|uniref:hypothetical protein n=1 Tax=Alkalibacterium sp. 20 TaxID=1798803 RepID=UPI00090018B6|nr:hypothetical protein [Alkalibacterium sp. 20]OJF92556.1 hypothetical protein AX762_10035 [Alkalibacterium sp. 20]